MAGLPVIINRNPTISYGSILYSKYQATFFDEALPAEIINVIRQESLKRENLGW